MKTGSQAFGNSLRDFHGSSYFYIKIKRIEICSLLFAAILKKI